MSTPSNTTILLVEDDENDIVFMRMALEDARVENPLVVVRDGREALEYLKESGVDVDRCRHPLPYLVLLDCKLPHVTGLEVLKWLRERPEFDPTVVLVLSSSANPADIDAAYKLGANGYLVKPSSYDKLQVLVQATKEFWLVCNEPATVFGHIDRSGHFF